jgi:hypothetical protein
LVAGTAAPAGYPSRLMEWRPLRLMGRWSYSWYLWHWPMLVLAEARFGPLSTGDKLLTSGLALMVAAASFRLIEDPGRRSRLLASTPAALMAGALAVVFVVAAAWALGRHGESELRQPYLATLLEARQERSHVWSSLCRYQVVDGDEECFLGPTDSTQLVLVVGDSKAGQWASAVAAAAANQGARTMVRSLSGCTAFDVWVEGRDEQGVSGQCLAYRAQTSRLVGLVHPDVVVTSNADQIDVLRPGTTMLLGLDDAVATWSAALASYIASIDQRGVPLVVIRDNPALPQDPLDCLARVRSDEACAVPRAELRSEPKMVDAESEVLRQHPVTGVFDPTPLICDNKVCHVYDGAAPIYSDSLHLTAQFVNAHVAELEDLLAPSLNSSR